MKLALADCRIGDECRRALMIRGFRVIELPPSGNIAPPMASHPDMLIAKLGNNIITSAEYCESASYIFTDIRVLAPEVKLHVADVRQRQAYPWDAIFNVLTIGKRLFAKTDTVCRQLLSLAKELGYEIIHTKQGYPACTVLPLGDRAAITADAGLAKTMRSAGIEVTEISSGGISLPPYEYGFIGGACGVSDDTVYFMGDAKTHPDFEKIAGAIENNGYSAVSLCPGELRDLGRIIFT